MPCLKPNYPCMKIYGAIAQLGERLPCTQEVSSSILLSSTILIFSALLANSHKRDYASLTSALKILQMAYGNINFF